MDKSEKIRQIQSISHEKFRYYCKYSESIAKKMKEKAPHIALPSGESVVQQVIMKILNAESALENGHAGIINGRIQIKSEFQNRDDIKYLYQTGFRLWQIEKHDLDGFIKVALISELRNQFNKSLRLPYKDVQLDDQNIAQEDAGDEKIERKLTIKSFLDSLDSIELRAMAQLVLVDGYGIVDIMVEFGLTRSQADKRIRKLMTLAESFDSRNHN